MDGAGGVVAVGRVDPGLVGLGRGWAAPADEEELSLQAGAGIVEASDPSAEFEETVNKAKAALVAIAAARGARAQKKISPD